MKVYLVAQNASHDIENEYNFLWSPKLTKPVDATWDMKI